VNEFIAYFNGACELIKSGRYTSYMWSCDLCRHSGAGNGRGTAKKMCKAPSCFHDINPALIDISLRHLSD